MSRERRAHPKNDGWIGVEYEFGVDPEPNAKLNDILNKAC